MNQFGFSDEILNDLLSAIQAEEHVDKAVIFGSRANGNYRNESDIDIAIFGAELSNEEFSTLWNKIDDLPIIFNIDCLHFEKLENDKLKQKIQNEGVTFYTK